MTDNDTARMVELMIPIERQIMMCDTPNEMLMLACAMLQRTHEIFEQILGKEGSRKMFTNLTKE